MTAGEMMIAAHHWAHEAPNDLDDTLTLQLTHRDAWLLMFMFFLTANATPCLEEEVLELHERFFECMGVQKPEWRADEDELEGEGS